jgi:hypothetical protein
MPVHDGGVVLVMVDTWVGARLLLAAPAANGVGNIPMTMASMRSSSMADNTNDRRVRFSLM